MERRTVFFVSDSTGLTAKTLGHSLLSQFEKMQFDYVLIPYVVDEQSAHEAVKRINQMAESTSQRPIVFITLIQPQAREIVFGSNSFCMDIFGSFIEPLEQEFSASSSHAIGRSHDIDNNRAAYYKRMDAVNFAMQHDDGSDVKRYQDADVILIGASRTGKTPTSIYLAMQFGVSAANYPLTDEDVTDRQLPTILQPHKAKLFGLSIDPMRLQQIRQERRPNSPYSSLTQCQMEIHHIESMYRSLNIPYTSTTKASVEEIATTIIQSIGLKKRAC